MQRGLTLDLGDGEGVSRAVIRDRKVPTVVTQTIFLFPLNIE